MPANVPTVAGELPPPCPHPLGPRAPSPAAGLGSENLPPASLLQPPLRLPSVADPSPLQAFAHAVPAAWDSVPCPGTPGTPVPPSAPQGSFPDALRGVSSSDALEAVLSGARAGV